MSSKQINMLFENEQFRMSRLQVFNWGTFSDLHDIPISQRGFLFVGGSGTGKTTLLDAFSTLLIPPRWVDFNAAAREADRSGRDRSLVSYIRGAWAEQKDGESGVIATRYLRSGTTWSALSLSYQNGTGQTVVLVQVFWLRGSANGSADVRRHYFIFEREFDLRELKDFGQSNLDIRKLKQSFPDTFSRDEFRSYCDHFCHLLGIENEIALRLLHKTQAAKNLGDLNTFLRDFMLDKPETFDVADRLVREFEELNAAHQAVVTARKQIETLVPAREKHSQMESMASQLNNLRELQAGINIYCETRRMSLLKERIASLNVEKDGWEGEIARYQSLLDSQTNILRELERQHREIGGDQIEQLESEKKTLEGQRTDRIRKRDQAAEACGELGWTLSKTPREFAELIGKAREEIEGRENKSKAARDEMLLHAGKKKEAEDAFTIVAKEVRALQSQLSNIPYDMLDLRKRIASAIGVSGAALPFAGELIEVKPDQSLWQGAIERVLHGFALSLLVDERYYSALSNYINSAHLGQRLVYYRTGRVEPGQDKHVSADSMVFKLNIKEGSYADWLKAELRQRFNYTCVESVQAFRAADRALTREGQVKHNKTRHEKDDRRTVNDRSNWVLGFDNREKLSLFQQRSQELAATISAVTEKINSLSEQDNLNTNRAIQCQTLVNLQWQEIDELPLIERISAIEKQIREMRDGNKELREISEQINGQKSLVDHTEKELREIRIVYGKTLDEIEKSNNDLSKILDNPSIVPLTPYQQTGLDGYFARITDHVQLDTLDRTTTSVVQTLNKEAEDINRGIAGCEKHIESVFTEFKRSWPLDAGDLDTSLSSAPDFFSKLTRLETDGLPAYEQRFFDLLQDQSNQNLAALSTYLNDARKTIHERMDLVNESLSQVPFNKSVNQQTYLHIDASDRQLQEVREFRQDLLQALGHAWSGDRDLAEDRFLTLQKLVRRLSNQDPEDKRWRESVLDVRQHVEFIGREIDEGGVEIEIYRSGAGKSGGQRQKLATTCLAAALRYQLGGNDLGIPMYAPVVLDEAFDKADNEFTALAMDIFNNFGFQMIVATPLKSVMTLEPFIGGACFVDINDRRVSSVLLIEYDSDRQRLKLPHHARREADVEVS
ncbi:MAG: hypothetical protein LBB81_11845 [Treponema sp.]|jgi:uncharacterized protein YPO0396|nr:hypothetical protein [Treponema sp.]